MSHQSSEKNFYPLFLDLSGLHCLVAGLGGVGSRKLQGLLQCAPASILALDMEAPAAGLLPLLERPCVRFEQRPFRD
ncbi:NAD(P)-dependent oxidoreductase, partial [uncultured Desulfovibrio sp.]